MDTACADLAGNPSESGRAGAGVALVMDIRVEEAVPACEAAAAARPDDPVTTYRLARAVYAARDYRRSFDLAWRAATQGYAPAQNLLGIHYLEGTGVGQDTEEAVRWITEAVNKGDKNALVTLGAMRQSGWGVPKDEALALEMLTEAAAAGVFAANFYIGKAYDLGAGVPQDTREAARQYQIAAAKGYPAAFTQLGILASTGKDGLEPDDKRAFEYFQKAADRSDGYGCYAVGWHYLTGAGVEKDLGRANEMFAKGASLGAAAAHYQIALSYQSGRGIRQDEQNALEHFRVASANGHGEAQTELGRLLGLKGIAGDQAAAREAVEWLTKAAEVGIAQAKYHLGVLYMLGVGTDKNQAKGYGLVVESDGQGFGPAAHLLGLMYYYGDQVEKDRERGLTYLRNAADAGFAESKTELTKIEEAEERQKKAAELSATQSAPSGTSDPQLPSSGSSFFDSLAAMVMNSDILREHPQGSADESMVAAFERRKEEAKQTALKVWEHASGQGFVRLKHDNNNDLDCTLFMLDDSGSSIVGVGDAGGWFGVAKRNWEGGEVGARGFSLSLAGVPFEDLVHISQPSGPDTFVWARGERSFFTEVSKTTHFWLQVMHGSNIEFSLDGERITKTMDYLSGNWARGSMKECTDIKDAAR